MQSQRIHQACAYTPSFIARTTERFGQHTGVTASQSLQVVQTLLRAGLGCIIYLRRAFTLYYSFISICLHACSCAVPPAYSILYICTIEYMRLIGPSYPTFSLIPLCIY